MSWKETKIVATEERCAILKANKINYAVDEELCLLIDSKQYKKAIDLFRKALVL